MGVLDHVSEMFDCSHGHKIKKRRQLQVTPSSSFCSNFRSCFFAKIKKKIPCESDDSSKLDEKESFE